MFIRILYIVLVLSMIAAFVMARDFPVCNDPCRTGGDVRTCCRNHDFSDGICSGDSASCF